MKPKADDQTGGEQAEPAPANWLENSISGLASMIIHMVLIICLSLITWGYYGGVGTGDDVLIGNLPHEVLSDAQEDKLESEDEVKMERDAESLDDPLEDIQPPTPDSSSESFDTLVATPSPSGGGSTSFELGSVSIGGSMSGGGWDGMIQQLKRNGLDIVIAFDSTGEASLGKAPVVGIALGSGQGGGPQSVLAVPFLPAAPQPREAPIDVTVIDNEPLPDPFEV